MSLIRRCIHYPASPNSTIIKLVLLLILCTACVPYLFVSFRGHSGHEARQSWARNGPISAPVPKILSKNAGEDEESRLPSEGDVVRVPPKRHPLVDLEEGSQGLPSPDLGNPGNTLDKLWREPLKISQETSTTEATRLLFLDQSVLKRLSKSETQYFKNRERIADQIRGLFGSKATQSPAQLTAKTSEPKRLIARTTKSYAKPVLLQPENNFNPSQKTNSDQESLLNQLAAQTLRNTVVRADEEKVTNSTVASSTAAQYYSSASPRVAIVTYIPNNDEDFYLVQFLAILFSSWRYVTSHTELALKTNISGFTPKLGKLVIADLLVFCEPRTCSRLLPHCPAYRIRRDLNNTQGSGDIGSKPSVTLRYPEALHNCVHFPMPEHPYAASYGWTNSFTFASDPDYLALQTGYNWIFRLDTDCLLTPPFLAWVPPRTRSIAMEYWGYCTEFNERRLEMIAEKQGLRNQKVHCIGSSFYLRPYFVPAVAELTLRLTIHLASKEFDPKLPGLEGVFKDDPEGEWPKWWRGVSLLYGTELALNALVPNLNTSWVENLLDRGTCGNRSIMTMVQLHCFHGDCEFSKFNFMDAVIHLRQHKILDPRLVINFEDRDVSKMNTREYAQFIAWHGAAHFVPELKALTAVAVGQPEPDLLEENREE